MPKNEVPYDEDDFCPKNPKNGHNPDWKSISVDSDGGEIYVDVCCKDCGRSGCLGTAKQLAKDISW